MDRLQRGQSKFVEKGACEKTRHIKWIYLWVQEVSKSGRVRIRRVAGDFNSAEHLTKGKAWRELERLIFRNRREGRNWPSWIEQASVQRTVIVHEDVAMSMRCWFL